METRDKMICLSVDDLRKKRPRPSSIRNRRISRVLVIRAAIARGQYPSEAMLHKAIDALLERILLASQAVPAPRRVCGER